MPSWAGDGPKEIIPFSNGLYDIQQRELLPHTDRYISTFCLDFAFTPEAACPRWLNFLGEVFDGDAERIGLLAQWFGYSLLSTTKYHKFLLKVGASRSGKSTIDGVLQRLLGRSNYAAFDIRSLGSSFGLSSLIGKRAAFASELHLEGARDRAAIVEKIKALVANDEVQIDRKYMEPITQRLGVKLNVSANAVPRWYDASNALARRVLLLRFEKSFAGHEDFELPDKLAAEIEGIAQWAINGAYDVLENGFSDLTDEDAYREMAREQSPAMAFLEDCCVIQSNAFPGGLRMRVDEEEQCCSVESLQDIYHEWSTENSVRRAFDVVAKEIKSLLPRIKKERRQIAGSRRAYYEGLGIAEWN